MEHKRQPERWLRVLIEAREFVSNRRRQFTALEKAALLTADDVARLWPAQRRDAVSLAGYRHYGRFRYTWWIDLSVATAIVTMCKLVQNYDPSLPQLPLDYGQITLAMAVYLIIFYGQRNLRHRLLPNYHQALATGRRILVTFGFVGCGLLFATAHGNNTLIAFGFGICTLSVNQAYDTLRQNLVFAAYARKLAQADRQSTVGYEVSNFLLTNTWLMLRLRKNNIRQRNIVLASLENDAWFFEHGLIKWVVPRQAGATSRLRRSTQRVLRHGAAALRAHADALAVAETMEAYDRIMSAMCNQALATAAGDLSVIMQETEPDTSLNVQSIATRLLSPLVLISTALVLPHLPSVSATGASLTGIQVGLLVGAVLSLLRISGDDRRSIESAWNSASNPKAKT